MSVQRKSASTVVSCYDLLDLAVTGGIEDYTEGIYEGNINRPYKDAQLAQGNYLLNEVRCRKGSRILDIGCGNGTLLEPVRARWAVCVGINISPPPAYHKIQMNSSLDSKSKTSVIFYAFEDSATYTVPT